jgi:glycosyltransferase involved in cell wall biosynthesis
VSSPHRTIRVLALSPIPEEGAGCRFRLAQFIPYLRAHGFEVSLRTLYTPDFFRLVYRPKNYARKALGFARLTARYLAALSDSRDFDVIFLYREILPIGPPLVEQYLTRPGHPPLVLDYDDAIFLPNVSEANRVISTLKMPQKLARTIARSRHVIVGNSYLADYARRYTSNVTIVPTCVDTDRWVPDSHGPIHGRAQSRPPVVGWIGSPTTGPYIRALADVLQRVGAQHPMRLRISGVARPLHVPGVETENIEWSLDREVQLFNTCDIGVYPLADDEWARGKCGFKAIQFMACGVPVVASAVGVNREIIEDGVNGFLASNADEWRCKLARLLDDVELRRRFAVAGRETIERRYSLAVNAPVLAEILGRAARPAEAGATELAPLKRTRT